MRLHPWWLICLTLYPAFAGAGGRDVGTEYQFGLYLQNTRGSLPAAIGAYERAAEGVVEPPLAESIYMRMAECLRLGGDRNTVALEALSRSVDPKWKRFGSAAMMPQQSDLVMQVDLSRLDPRRWAEKMHVELPATARRWLRLFERLSKLDLGRDVHSLTLGLTLKSDPARLFDHVLLIVEGDLQQFDPMSVADFLRVLAHENGTAVPQAGGALLRTAEPKTFRIVLPTENKALEAECCRGMREILLRLGTERFRGLDGLSASFEEGKASDQAFQVGLVKVDDRRVLLGERRALLLALDAIEGRLPGVRGNNPMASLMSQVPADAVLWLVARPEPMLKQVEVVHTLLGLEGEMPEVTGLTASLGVGAELRLEATATTSNLQSTRVLGDLALGSLAVLRMTAGAKDEEVLWLTAFLRGVTLDVQGRQVRLVARLPQEAIPPAAP